MRRTIVFAIVLFWTSFFLSSCSLNQIVTPTLAPSSTRTITSSPSSTFTRRPTKSQTPIPTSTPTSTNTPILDWPLEVKTPLPFINDVITVDNSVRLTRLSYLYYDYYIRKIGLPDLDGKIRALDGIFSSQNEALTFEIVVIPENSNDRPHEIWSYNLYTGELTKQYNSTYSNYYSNYYPDSPDGNFNALCKNNNIVLDNRKGNIKLLGQSICNHLASLTFSPDSSLLAHGGGYGNIRVWQVQDAKKVLDFKSNCFLSDVEISQDNTILIASCKNEIRVIRISDGDVLRMLSSRGSNIAYFGVAFSSDQKIIASFSDGYIDLWAIGKHNSTQNTPKSSPTPITDIVLMNTYITFAYPKDGQLCGYDGPFYLQVNPVKGADGYLWSFYQNGELVWENLRDEGSLSTNNYVFEKSSLAHDSYMPGDLTIGVRAKLFGGWSKEATITVKIR